MCLTALRIRVFVWVMEIQCISYKNSGCFSPYSAYQNNDITEFEKILKTNHSNIMDDPFIREHIEGECGKWLKSTFIINVLLYFVFVFFTKCSWWRYIVLQSSYATLELKCLSNSSSHTQEYTSLSFLR